MKIVFDKELFCVLQYINESDNPFLLDEASLMLANFEKANIFAFPKTHICFLPALNNRINDWLNNFTVSIPPIQALFSVQKYLNEDNWLRYIARRLINSYYDLVQ